MLHFDSDYMEGAHPDVLRRLVETNMEQTTGYGDDVHSREAWRKIAEACGLDDAEVHLLVGGTQTNAVVLGALLRPWEGVVAAETGHIAVHEAGAIEATGHKVLTVPSHAGKVAAGDVEALFDDWAGDANREHEVRPAVVYVSQPTEWGTLYTLDELRGLSEVCRRKGLLLYVDGARLGYGLAADTTGVTLPVLFFLRGLFLAYGAAALLGGLTGSEILCAALVLGPGGLLTVPALFLLGTAGLLRRSQGSWGSGIRPLLLALPALALCVVLDQMVVPKLLTVLLKGFSAAGG